MTGLWKIWALAEMDRKLSRNRIRILLTDIFIRLFHHSCPRHDKGRGSLCFKQVSHLMHVWGSTFVEHIVAAAEGIQTCVTVFCAVESMFRAFSMAEMFPFASETF
jgi:hypothetical protein